MLFMNGCMQKMWRKEEQKALQEQEERERKQSREEGGCRKGGLDRPSGRKEYRKGHRSEHTS
jgi:hypothetical protein